MTIEEMKRRKLERGYSYAQLSELSGVPLGTVQKIFSGDTEHPRYATLQALEQVLKDRDGGMALSDSAAFSYGSPRERKQGEYTVADYLAMPEEFRGELIDGVICDMAAPTFDHQKIAGEIYRQIVNYIMDNGGECEAGMSPIDVQLDYFKKLMKYENAGVREYWILDPYKKQLVVFFFEADIYAQIHDMTEPVPVNIYGGKLRIRTDHILEWCGNMER